MLPGALEKLVEEGHSLAYGARFLKRVIDDKIKLPISQQWKNGRDFIVRVKDDAVVVECKAEGEGLQLAVGI